MNKTLFFKTSFLAFILTLTSCSSDDNNPEPIETPISVTTQDFSITIDENPVNAQVIGTVEGSTNEGNVTFSITEQNPTGAFAIDPVSGELTVADASLFKFELNPVITGNVKVANGDIFENSSVTITLNEIDNIYEGDVWVLDQEELDLFGSLGYTSISGDLLIGNYRQYSNINNLESLSSLKNIGGDLEIKLVHLLPTLEGLNNLQSIGGDLLILRNEILINIEALNKLTEIPGNFWVGGNNQLAEHTGLQNIITVSGDLRLDSFDHTNLVGLSGITTVGGDLILFDNMSMQSIDLTNITHIGGNLDIGLNDRLTNLAFISNLSEIYGNLRVRNNHRLKDFCALQPLLSTHNLGGTFTVENNAFNPTRQDIIDGNCAI